MKDLARVLLDSDRWQDESGTWHGPDEAAGGSAPGGNGTGRPSAGMGEDRGRLIERAGRYVDRMPASISGSHGHDAAWHVAVVLIRGFKLTAEEAWPIFLEFNTRCQPPWSEKELRHKLEDAENKARLPWGYIVNGAPRARTIFAGVAVGNGDDRSNLQTAHPAGTAPEKAAPGGYRFTALSSEDFFKADFGLTWLVERLLVAMQAGVLGGPRKALKTSIGIDLFVSLATATPFLGHFKVYKQRKVLLISGESGEATIQETGRRICAARGVDPYTLSAYWSFRLPQAASPVDRGELQKGIQELGVEVVGIDPLYLSLLVGADAREIEAGNLYTIGPLLSDLSRACLDVGCTPLLFHHARKNVALDGQPMELEHLTFGGISEFTRQWLLVNRRESYEPGTGSHKLWLSAGGSVGHGGVWGVDIEEGRLREDFQGRTWEITITTAGESRREEEDTKATLKERQKEEATKRDGTKILVFLDRLAKKKGAPADGAAGYNQVRDLAHLSGAAMTRATQALVDEGVLEECDFNIKVGHGRATKRTAKGVRRKQKESPGLLGQAGENPSGPSE
jgi:hypothetical protein